MLLILNVTWIDPVTFRSKPSKVVNPLWHDSFRIPNYEANDNRTIEQAVPVATFVSMFLLFIKHLQKPILFALSLLFMFSNKLTTDPVSLVIHMAIIFRSAKSCKIPKFATLVTIFYICRTNMSFVYKPIISTVLYNNTIADILVDIKVCYCLLTTCKQYFQFYSGCKSSYFSVIHFRMTL